MCKTCDAPPTEQSDDERTPCPRRAITLWRRLRPVWSVALVVALIGALALAADARSDAAVARRAARAADARLAALEAAGRALDAGLDDAQTTLAAVERRISGVAATIDELPDATEIARKVTPSVFTVETEDGSGSAFVITSGGGRSQLITNAHVVASVYDLGARGVRLVTGERTYAATITAISHRYDLALIDVNQTLPAIERAEERALPGDPVFVVGSPLGYEGTVGSGNASSYRTEEGIEYLHFDAVINPGSSGGPVVDVEGRVLAVSTLKIAGYGIEGLSFAVPIERVCDAFSIC